MRPEHVLAHDPRVLSQAERGAYFEQGYVLCRGLLDGDWLARMRNAYGRAVERFGPVPSLIEWDTNIPELSTLMTEAAKADAVRAAHLGGDRDARAA